MHRDVICNYSHGNGFSSFRGILWTQTCSGMTVMVVSESESRKWWILCGDKVVKNKMLRNIVHTKSMRVAKMSTSYFVNICFSSSDISLLFCYFKYSLCFRIIFPSKGCHCRYIPLSFKRKLDDSADSSLSKTLQIFNREIFKYNENKISSGVTIEMEMK